MKYVKFIAKIAPPQRYGIENIVKSMRMTEPEQEVI